MAIVLLRCTWKVVPTSLVGTPLPPRRSFAWKITVPALPRCCSSSSITKKIEPPNILQLAEKARIKLTAEEVEDFRPKLEQIGVWFSQLQEVDLENISPALRVDVGSEVTLRPDVPSTFEHRNAMFDAVPEIEGHYVKVPKILNENVE